MVDTEDCLEQCEGTIADFIRLNDAKNEDRLKPFLKDYGRFKFSEISNLNFLITYTNFNIKLRSKLKYVLISFSSSTFDRIKKVNIQYIICTLHSIQLTRSDLNDWEKKEFEGHCHNCNFDLFKYF